MFTESQQLCSAGLSSYVQRVDDPLLLPLLNLLPLSLTTITKKQPKTMQTTPILLAAAFMSLPSFAQKEASARKVLDKTAATLSSLKGIKTGFEITTFVGTSEQGATRGSMYLDGKRYMLESPDMLTWYDGDTQWAYLPGTNEVNVSCPTLEEQQTTNPYAFVSLYKKGYNYTMKQVNHNGEKAYEVTLKAEDVKTDIQEVRVNISSRYIPYSIRVRQGQTNWTRIRIHNLQGKQKFSKGTFTFPSDKYPDAEVIDLR